MTLLTTTSPGSNPGRNSPPPLQPLFRYPFAPQSMQVREWTEETKTKIFMYSYIGVAGSSSKPNNKSPTVSEAEKRQKQQKTCPFWESYELAQSERNTRREGNETRQQAHNDGDI